MGVIDVIKSFALREIDLCKNEDELKQTEKRWKKYIACLNKYMAGKGAIPYFDEKGNVVWE